MFYFNNTTTDAARPPRYRQKNEYDLFDVLLDHEMIKVGSFTFKNVIVIVTFWVKGNCYITN